MQCKAISKRSGQQCKKYAMKGTDVCSMHGGKTPSGVASSNYRHGKRSGTLQGQRAIDFLNALESPELLSLREAVARSEVEVLHASRRLDTGESDRGWQDAKGWFDKLKSALSSGDLAKTLEARTALDDIFEIGTGQALARREYQQWILTQAKIAAAERKIMIEDRKLIQTEVALALLNTAIETVNASIKKHLEKLNRQGVDVDVETIRRNVLQDVNHQIAQVHGGGHVH